MNTENDNVDAGTEVAANTEAPTTVDAPVAEAKSTEPEVQKKDRKLETTKREAVRPGVIVSGGDYDEVHLSKCVFKNVYSKKSLSIHHVQRRLVELGHKDAVGDKDGWYGDLTRAAIVEFQKSKNLTSDGVIDLTTLELLFAGDPHVKVVSE